MFGDKIKALREAKGLSQSDVGNAIGISSRVIGYYEANNRFPKEQRILVDLANLFNVSVDFLVDNDYDSSKREQAAEEIYKIFRDKGLIVEGEEITEEMLEAISALLDSAICNAEQINKIQKGK
ncbi:helix-turn-helix domain-containing protein [Fusibacter sp. JL216-2]|uniref:helix-turn-helix domain-containing protein n=1 Tax=Fusibacter sp. JL216-2 TaxID=3071453 RepID=UPI003D33D6A5